MFYRLFLGNDGRALAIDYTGHLNGGSTSLFRESFRFWFSLLGLPPVNPILGKLLYMEAFSAQGNVGANPSSTSLLIAYGGDYERLLFSIGLCFAAIMIFIVIRMHNKYSIVTSAIGIMLLGYLSQDFGAFQVSMNILFAVGVSLCLFLLGRNMLISASHQSGTHLF